MFAVFITDRAECKRMRSSYNSLLVENVGISTRILSLSREVRQIYNISGHTLPSPAGRHARRLAYVPVVASKAEEAMRFDEAEH